VNSGAWRGVVVFNKRLVSLELKRKETSALTAIARCACSATKTNTQAYARGRQQHNKQQAARGAGVVDGVLGAIGNTPLIRIRSLSEATGCEVGCVRMGVVGARAAAR